MKSRATDKFFSHKDWREQLQILIRNHSFSDVERMFYNGMIGERCWGAYCRIWSWTGWRSSNVAMAGPKQEAFWAKHGKEAFLRKMNKTRLAFGFEAIPA